MYNFHHTILSVSLSMALQENLEDFAMMEVLDNGKPIWEARLDIWTAIDSLDFFAGLAPSLAGKIKALF